MQINLSSTAIRHLQEIIDCHLEFCGERSAMKLSTLVDDKLRTLSKFPEFGAPEELLKGHKIQYRSKQINKRYKFIYHIAEDTIIIDAFWDMRMHPDNLVNRI